MAINLTDAMNKLRQALNESQNRYTPAQTNNHVQRSFNTNNITNNSRLQSRPTSKVSATVNPVGTNVSRIRKLGTQTNYNNRSTNTHNAVVNRQNSTNTAQNNVASAITRAAQNVAQNVENLRNEASRYGVGGDLTNAGNGQTRTRANNERTGQNRVLAQRKLANPDYYQQEYNSQGLVSADDWLTLNNRGEYQDSGILRNREKQKIEKDRQERMENAQIDDLVNSALQVLTPEFLYSYAPNSLKNVNTDNNDFKSRSVNTLMLANIENNQDLRNYVRSEFNVDENTARNLISIAVSNAKNQFNTQQAIDRAINQKEVNNPLDYVASLVQGLSSGANAGFQGLNQEINNLSLLNPFQSELGRRADEERLKAMASLNENLSTPEYENVGGIAGLGQQLAPIIGGQAPQLLVGSVFGPTAGLGTLFASAMGSSTGQALQEGAESDEALLYGLTSGAIETATEKMFDVVGVLGRGVVGDAMSNLAGKIFSGRRGKALSRYLINSLGEGAEEVVSEYLDAFARGIYDEDQREKGFMEKINETTPDALQSGLLGALSGGLLGLGSQIAEQRQISRDINAQQAQNAARSSEQARDRANRITQYPNTMQQVQAAQYSTDEQVGQALEGLGLRDDMVGIDPENISQIEQVLEDEIIDDIQPELVIELNDEITGDESNDGTLRRTIGLDELHEFDYRLDDPITVENTPLARSVANSTDHSFNGTGQAVSNYFGTEYSDDVKNALYNVRDSLRNDGEVSAESLDGLASTLAQQIVREQRVNNVMFNTIDAIESQPIDTLQLNNFINDPATAQMYPQVIGTVTDTDSLTRLYQLHQEATALKPYWDESQSKLVNDIANKLGYRVVGLNSDPNFSYKSLGNIIIDPGAKSIGSAVNKVLRSANKIDDFGNVYSLESIKDHNRLSVQVDSVKSLLELLDYFKVNHGASVEVMDGSRPDGYIGFHATWQDENGTRNEIQISPDFDVKQQSEALYQQVRDINKNSATPEQLRMIDQVNAESKALWNQLAKDFGLTPEVMRMASSSDTGRWASRNGRSNGNPEGTHSPVDLLKNSRTFPASANSNAPSSSIKNPFIDSLLSSNRILSRYDVNGVKQAIKNELDGSIGSIELRMLPVIREMNIREYGQQRLNQGQDVAVENETPQGRVSQTVKSVANSNMFTEQTRQNLMDMASRGNFSRDSRNFAQFYSEMEDFVDNYNGNIVNDLLTDDPATNGFSMFGNLDRAQAVLSIVEERLKAQGNYEDAGRLGVVWQKYASQSGQDLNTVQQIYKMFPKKARDKAIIAQTEEIINQANRALGRDNDGNAPKIVLTEQDKADLRNAKNPSQKQKEIATRTLKASRNSSIGAKLQALRYAFMLYNPKTWIRNFLGNEINTGFNNIVVNNINALLDKTIGKGLAKGGGNNYLPTTTFTVEKKYKDLARRILPTEKEINNGARVLVNLDSGLKYGSTDVDSLAFNSDWGRKLYKTITKPMDLALNAGDKVFFDATFRDRLARFLQANKNTVDFDFAERYFTDDNIKLTNEADQNKANIIERGIEYANQQALKSVYRQKNELVSVLNKLQSQDSRSARIAYRLLNLAQPFLRTNLNITMQALENSPVGLAMGIYDTYRAFQNKGKKAGHEALNELAHGLAGTGAVALGYILYNLGMITGSGQDMDDEEREILEDVYGWQPYSIHIRNGDKDIYYDMSWANPMATSIALGSAIAESDIVKTGELTTDDPIALMQALSTALITPVTDMSMMESLEYIAPYNSDSMSDAITQVVFNILENAASGFVTPSLLRNINRAFIDPTIRTVNGSAKGDTGYFGARVKSGLPVLSKDLQPALNSQGNTMMYGESWNDLFGLPKDSAVGRIFSQFISPGDMTSSNNNATTDELMRLSGQTGEYGILPDTSVERKVTYEGKDYELTNEQFTRYNQQLRTERDQMIQELQNTQIYQNMTDQEKVDMIDDYDSYLKEKVKNEYLRSQGVKVEDSSTVKKAEAAEKLGMDMAEYFLIKHNAGTSQANIMTYMLNSGYTANEVNDYIFNVEKGGVWTPDKEYQVQIEMYNNPNGQWNYDTVHNLVSQYSGQMQSLASQRGYDQESTDKAMYNLEETLRDYIAAQYAASMGYDYSDTNAGRLARAEQYGMSIPEFVLINSNSSYVDRVVYMLENGYDWDSVNRVLTYVYDHQLSENDYTKLRQMGY